MHPGAKISRLDQAAENAYMDRNGQHIVFIERRENVLLKLEDVHLVRSHNPGAKQLRGSPRERLCCDKKKKGGK